MKAPLQASDEPGSLTGVSPLRVPCLVHVVPCSTHKADCGSDASLWTSAPLVSASGTTLEASYTPSGSPAPHPCYTAPAAAAAAAPGACGKRDVAWGRQWQSAQLTC